MKKQLLKKMLSLLISSSVLLGSGFCVMADEADKEQPEDVGVVETEAEVDEPVTEDAAETTVDTEETEDPADAITDETEAYESQVEETETELVHEDAAYADLNEGDVEINEDNFPDDVFREFVRSFDLDENDILSQEELSEVTEISISNDQLTDLTGIEYFDYTLDLDCSYSSNLKSLNLSGMAKLETLEIDNCQLTSLEIYDLPDLETISCHDNGELSTLKLSNLPKLDYLDCSNTAVTSLDVNGMTKLRSLECYGCRLTSLEIKDLSYLESIRCWSNDYLSVLKLSNLPKLKEVYCRNCNLSSLEVTDCPIIREINCSNNAITSLVLRGVTELSILHCENNNLSSLNVLGCTELVDLTCYKNSLSELDISLCQKLKDLYFSVTKNGKNPWRHDGILTYSINRYNLEIDTSTNVITDYGDYGWKRNSVGLWYKTPDGYLKDGWFCLDEYWYFFDSNGYAETNCWKEREADSWSQNKDPDWYYLDENGACCVGWKYISGKWYYFHPDPGVPLDYSDKGKMYSDGIYAIEEVVGIVEGKTIKDHRDYYFNKSGAMQTGWIDYQGKRYYAFSNGQLAETLVSIDGCYYLFDRYDNYLIETVGEKSNGWILAGGEYYYVDSDGVLTTGYAWINGKYYHFDEKGVMLTCKFESYTDEPSPIGAPGDTHYIYFGEDGAMVTSEFKYLSIRVHYPDPLVYRDGPIVDYDSVPPIYGWYYFDENGDMLFGSQIIDGRKYLFDYQDGNLRPRDWEYINGDWYYYKNEEPVTGWLKISDKWYYFEQSGVMQTGWHQTEGKWYYLSDDGAMVTGWNWQKISGKWYYFAPDGAMFNGWHKDGNTWYYFDKSGAMKTGWYFSDNSWYYFDDSGAMVTGTVKLSDRTYEFDDSGACQNPYSPK